MSQASPSSDTPAPGPVRGLRALLVALVLCGVSGYHVLMTLVYLSPPNLLKQALGETAERYMAPLFYQNWHLFSPEPGISSTKFAFQCLPEGGEWGPWRDPLVSLHDDFYAHRIGGYGKLIYVYRDLAIGLKQSMRRVQAACLERYPEDDPTRYVACDSNAMMEEVAPEPSFELAMRFTRTACTALLDPGERLAGYTFKTLEFFPLKYSERVSGEAEGQHWSKVIEVPYPIFEVVP